MGELTKAEIYLKNRLKVLSDEKVILATKINNLEIEIEEVEKKIIEMGKDVDDSFEIFSPHVKKNDFIRDEIVKLKETKEDLVDELTNLKKKVNIIDEDMLLIQDALSVYDDEIQNNDVTGENDGDDVTGENVEVVNANYKESLIGIKILECQENDRQRIARELHDSTVQVLTNLVHKCEICFRIMSVDSVRAKLELEIMSKTLKETIEDMRNIIYDLRPLSIDDLNFADCMHNVIDKLKSTTNSNINLLVSNNVPGIKSVITSTIMRIIQEAVNNSIKHASAKEINVNIDYNEEKDSLKIEISDNGIGFDVDRVFASNHMSNSGFGLHIMKERVLLLSGSIDYQSKIGEGTKIVMEIPV